MKTWAVLGTGPSMSQETADYLKGKCNVVAVSDSYRLAPWADALVSYDLAWWRVHVEALGFSGEKYCRHSLAGTEQFNPCPITIGCNSGLMGMYLAKKKGAERILLLGFDMHGTHFFGKHGEGLKNTTGIRFSQHIRQFKRFAGPEVINCTPGSALKQFPISDIRDIVF